MILDSVFNELTPLVERCRWSLPFPIVGGELTFPNLLHKETFLYQMAKDTLKVRTKKIRIPLKHNMFL